MITSFFFLLLVREKGAGQPGRGLDVTASKDLFRVRHKTRQDNARPQSSKQSISLSIKQQCNNQIWQSNLTQANSIAAIPRIDDGAVAAQDKNKTQQTDEAAQLQQQQPQQQSG